VRGAPTLAVSLEQLKYPFSVESRSTAQKLAKDVGSLVNILNESGNNDLIEEAEERVYAAISQSEIKLPEIDREEAVLVYQTARLIVEKVCLNLNSPGLRRIQAEAESKSVNKHLSSERDRVVTSLCADSLGWHIESTGTNIERSRLPLSLRSFEYRIRFEDFLEVAPSFRSVQWKLINRHLDAGWVPIRKSELHRLMSGKFKKLIVKSEIRVPTLPMRLTEAVQRFEGEMETRRKEWEPVEYTADSVSAFPPCIEQLHQDSINQKNVSHFGRFAMAAFLIKIGMGKDDMMRIFRAAPDFVQSLASYQIDHIKGKEYEPPKCDTMQNHSLCPVYLRTVFDPLCTYVLRPVQFYKTRSWENSKGITDHSWYARKRTKRQNF
jgi:DNA primase large subunit